MDFKTWENSDSNEYIENYEQMVACSERFSLDDTVQRDGMFDDDCVYLVYDDSDVQKMIVLLHEILFLSAKNDSSDQDLRQ